MHSCDKAASPCWQRQAASQHPWRQLIVHPTHDVCGGKALNSTSCLAWSANVFNQAGLTAAGSCTTWTRPLRDHVPTTWSVPAQQPEAVSLSARLSIMAAGDVFMIIMPAFRKWLCRCGHRHLTTGRSLCRGIVPEKDADRRTNLPRTCPLHG